VNPVKNWGFEEIGTSAYECPPWESNNGGWVVRGDVNGDGIVDIFDLTAVSITFEGMQLGDEQAQAPGP
jgi:hypothetical protein